MFRLDKFELPKGFRGRNAVIVQLWWLVQAIFFKPSPQFMYGWRRFLVRVFGGKIGRKVNFRPSCQITYPWKLEIGDFSWIGDDVVLYSLGNIKIGSHTVISQRSYICTGSHDYTQMEFPIYALPIDIADSCWLATDVFVAPGVTICSETIVGSRSSVFKPITEKGVYAGQPLRKIK
ncbi:MAG TPA: WcaF family extracellular polysaccharide biosynthesis acetyltransferase [Flavobacterium sp.]|nr:WcaF family extracellular polysaccharide biosynthesis acetyltransferase [Flavobacterium sp.]